MTYRPLPDVGVTVTVDFNMTPDNFTYIKQLDEFFDGKLFLGIVDIRKTLMS